MRVSVLVPRFFSPESDAFDQHLREIIEVLASTGVCVTLFTFASEEGAGARLAAIREANTQALEVKTYAPRRIALKGIPPQYFCTALVNDLLEHSADIVHVYDFSQIYFLSALTKKGRAPLVLSPVILPAYHSHLTLLQKLWTTFLLGLGKKVSAFLVDIPASRKALLDLGISKEKIAALSVETDYPKMSSLNRQDEAVVLTVGRYAPNKGLHILIDAVPAVLERHPEIVFYLVGTVSDKEYYKQLKKMARGWEEHIHLTGPLPEEALLSLFSRARLFVFPSINDPHGLINLEAMAAGIAVIATRVDGSEALIHDGHNGILVTPDNVFSLSQGILDLLDSKEKRDLLAEKGRETAKNHYWKKHAEATLAFYSRIIEAQKQHPTST